MTMTSGRAVAACVVALVVATACSEDPVGPPDGVGSYAVVEIDGVALPVTLADGTMVESGSLGLDPSELPFTGGRRCASAMSFTPVGGSSSTVNLLCKWTQTRQSIVVEWETLILNFGILDGDRITLTINLENEMCPAIMASVCDDSVWVFER